MDPVGPAASTAPVRTLTPSLLLALGLLAVRAEARSFEAEQRSIPRVRAAFAAGEGVLRRRFAAAGAPFPPSAIYLRAFKREGVLELWAATAGGRHALIESYPICAASGRLGPKRREGDGQVPEGFYRLNHFNPASNYHLSLGIDYPNTVDRRRGERQPGGAIYIHGDCVTIGCIPITDERIEELYVAAVLARSGGQALIPVHVFPARLTASGMAALEREYAGSAALLGFWRNLKEGYDRFERDRLPPRADAGTDGAYRFR